MADETIEFEATGGDKVAADYRKLIELLEALGEVAAEAGKDLEKAGDQTEGAGKKTAQTAKQTESFTDKLSKAVVVLKAYEKAIVESVQKGAQLEASQSRLNSTMTLAGLTADQQGAVLAAAARSTDTLGVSAAEANDHLSRLLGTTKDSAKATRLYTLAMDIASQESTVELKDAVELLTNAHKGEVEELKKLNGINKETAEELAKVEDATERARLATQLLAEQYGGLAQANAGAEEKLKATTAQLEVAQANAGLVVIRLGELTSKTVEATGAFDSGEISVRAFAGGMGVLASQIDEASDSLSILLSKAVQGQLLKETVEEGGLFGVISKADTEAAKKAAENRPRTPPEQGPEFDSFGPEFTPEIELQIVREREEAKRKAEEDEKKRRADASKRLKEREREEQEAHRDRMERLREEQEAQNRHAESENTRHEWRLDQLAQERRERTEKAQKLIDGVKSEGEAAQKKADQEQTLHERQQQLGQDVALASAQAAANIASSHIKNEGAKAAISGAMEVARALAAAATPFGAPAAIAHGAAAAQFFAIAATAGMGGGAKKVPSGGVASSGGASSARQRSDLGTRSDRTARDPGPAQVQPLVMNFPSAFPPSPEQAAALAKAVARDARRKS